MNPHHHSFQIITRMRRNLQLEPTEWLHKSDSSLRTQQSLTEPTNSPPLLETEVLPSWSLEPTTWPLTCCRYPVTRATENRASRNGEKLLIYWTISAISQQGGDPLALKLGRLRAPHYTKDTLRSQQNVLGQTAASVCEVSPRFQGVTPYLSSGCCWWLGKTKIDNQVSYCLVSPFGRDVGWNATQVSGRSQEVVELGLVLSSRHTFYEVLNSQN
jgi:hypothetical protein